MIKRDLVGLLRQQARMLLRSYRYDHLLRCKPSLRETMAMESNMGMVEFEPIKQSEPQ